MVTQNKYLSKPSVEIIVYMQQMKIYDDTPPLQLRSKSYPFCICSYSSPYSLFLTIHPSVNESSSTFVRRQTNKRTQMLLEFLSCQFNVQWQWNPYNPVFIWILELAKKNASMIFVCGQLRINRTLKSSQFHKYSLQKQRQNSNNNRMTTTY